MRVEPDDKTIDLPAESCPSVWPDNLVCHVLFTWKMVTPVFHKWKFLPHLNAVKQRKRAHRGPVGKQTLRDSKHSVWTEIILPGFLSGPLWAVLSGIRLGFHCSNPDECLCKSHLPGWHSCSHVVTSHLFRPTPGSCVQWWARWTRRGWRMAALDFNYLISEWAGRATLAEPAQEPGLWGHQKEEGSETVSHAKEHKVSGSRTERARVLYRPLGKNGIPASELHFTTAGKPDGFSFPKP